MLELSHFCSLPATIAVFSTVVQDFNWSTPIAREWGSSNEDRCDPANPAALVEELEIINRTTMEMQWIEKKVASEEACACGIKYSSYFIRSGIWIHWPIKRPRPCSWAQWGDLTDGLSSVVTTQPETQATKRDARFRDITSASELPVCLKRGWTRWINLRREEEEQPTLPWTALIKSNGSRCSSQAPLTPLIEACMVKGPWRPLGHFKVHHYISALLIWQQKSGEIQFHIHSFICQLGGLSINLLHKQVDARAAH